VFLHTIFNADAGNSFSQLTDMSYLTHVFYFAFIPAFSPSSIASFQASTVKYTRTVLFWVVMQRVVVIPYQTLGTTHQSLLQGTRFLTQKNTILFFSSHPAVSLTS